MGEVPRSTERISSSDYVCLSIFTCMLYYGLNKIMLAFDAQYKTVILTLLTYLLT